MAQDTPKPDADTRSGDQSDYQNRNFSLPPDQVEWLRTTAFFKTTSQAELVREGIALRQAVENAGLDVDTVVADLGKKRSRRRAS